MQAFQEIKNKFKKLSDKLNDPSITADPVKLKEISQEYSDTKELAEKISLFEQKEKELKDSEELLNDPELKIEAEIEVQRLKKEISDMRSEIEYELLPKDPRDRKNAIIEIRAGAGGDESALFAAELFRMYARYAESKRLGHDVISMNRIRNMRLFLEKNSRILIKNSQLM